MGFQEVCKFYYTSGFHEPGSALATAMNRDVFDSLTPSQQKIFEIAAGEVHSWSLAQSNANNAVALERLKAGGVKVLEFSDEIWDAFGKASKEALDEFMGDELFARVRASAESAMAATHEWLDLSDNVFTRQRTRVNNG